MYEGAAPDWQINRTPLAPDAAAFRSRFKSGPILAETFSVYSANFLPFIFISIVALSPRILVALLMTDGQPHPVNPGQAAGNVFGALSIRLLTQLLGTQLATAAVTYGVFQEIRGRETTIGDCLKVGLSAIWSVLAIALLSGLLIGLGFLVCIIPGILLAVRWAVAVPVTVEERLGPIEALKRSGELTDGLRHDIFSVLFIVGLINLGLGLALGLGVGLTLGAKGSELAQLVAQVLATGLGATATAVMYYRLRSLKESIDVREIASVFD